jgi:hypothetical protein
MDKGYILISVIVFWLIVMSITASKLKEDRFINGHLISAAILFPAIFFWTKSVSGFEKMGWFILSICFLFTSLIFRVIGTKDNESNKNKITSNKN